MTIMFRPFAAALALAATLLSDLAPAQGFGPGLLVPPDPLPIPREPQLLPLPLLMAPPIQRVAIDTGLLQVRTEITDGAATTTLTQTLRNRTGAPQEYWWMLPLPDGALADRFTLTAGGVAMPGEVLDAQKARSIYEEIVRRRRDPGLLEYLGNGCLRARVFPVPPQGEVQVTVRYTQLLSPSDGIQSFRFPLRAAWLDGIGPEKLSFVVAVHSQTAIKTAWSPLSELAIARDGDHRLLASAEYVRGAMPARDLVLHFGLAEQDFGASVLTWRAAGQPGYFVVWLAPKRDWPPTQDLVRSVNLVLDTSGSMAGEKIQQARAAVRTFVLSLAPGDYFNVIPFSTDARPFFAEPVPADQAHRDDALAKVDQLEARGGTNIAEALGQALQHGLPAAASGRRIVPMTIFLTDGLPTVGTTDIDALLQQVKNTNAGRARIFVFGVGHDVNTRLLDTMAADSRGDRDYVQPGEDIEQKTGSLFAKLAGPVMTDVQLTIDDLQIDELEPRALPDLFVQGQLAIVGRYRGEGHKAIRLRGNVGTAAKEYVFEATFPAAAKEHDWLPTLWAQRKVAALLDAIRMHGQNPELVAEVTRLGKEFGLVTPFTSHLVVEEGLHVAAARGVRGGASIPGDGRADERLRLEWRRAGLDSPAAAVPLLDLQKEASAIADGASRALAERTETGAAAVAQSVSLLAMARGEARADTAVDLLHHRIADRSFHLVDGVWVDAAWTAANEQSVRKIVAFSDDYFALLRSQPDLRPFLAFSTRIVVVGANGEAIEVIDPS